MADVGTPLRWVGGKLRQAALLADHLRGANWSPETRFVDPFLGGGSVFFQLGPGKSLLADANPFLVSFFEHLRDQPHEVYAEAMSLCGGDSKETYLGRREEFNELKVGSRKAALFFYLNRTGFNGIWRVNLRGQYNVPFGGRVFAVPALDDWLTLSKVLTTAELHCCDWKVVFDQVRSEDVVFVDPPYLGGKARETFSRYTSPAFDEEAHRELASRLWELSAMGGQFVLTLGDNDLTRQIYGGFDFLPLRGRFTVGARGPHLPSNELIALNF